MDNLLSKISGTETNEIRVNKFDEDSAGEFRSKLMEAAKGDPRKPIIIYIDSYGGYVDSLAMMIEAMDEVPNPLITVCHGKAMSCGAILLSHGDLRFCGKHSRIMVHEVSGGVHHGNVHDMYADAIEVKRLNRRFMGLLAKNCDIKGGYDGLRKMIKDADGRDKYLDAEEAVTFGIVDAVGTPSIDESTLYSVSIVELKKKLRDTAKATKAAKAPKKSRKKTDSK